MQRERARDQVEVTIEGRTLRLTNLDKVLWPDARFTKRQMISYYVAIAPALLPHVHDRPMTLKRYPEGVEGIYWFQTRCRGAPRWIDLERIPNRRGGTFDYCVIASTAALVWAANAGAIELHPLLGHRAHVGEARIAVFDLDPGPPAGLLDCCRVALALRESLDRLALQAFVKTSGATGLHVYVPLNLPHDHEEVKRFVRERVRDLAEQGYPVVLDAARAARAGRVFVDWSQNNPIRSIVAPYSLRALPLPTVSTPVGWDELEGAVVAGDEQCLRFLPADVLERLEDIRDPFEPVIRLEQELPWGRGRR